MSLYETVKARYDACIREATELAQQGVTERRELSVEEKNKFEGLMAEAEGHAARMTSIAEGEKRAKDIEASYRGSGQQQRQDGAGVDSEFAQWARSANIGDAFDMPSVFGAEARALAAVRAGTTEARAMAADGGVSPDGVYGRLWEYAVAGSQILQAGVTIINTSDGNTIPLPVVTAHATTATGAANAALTASDSSIGLVQVGANKDQFYTDVPTELISDLSFDVEAYIARNAGRQLGNAVSKRGETAAIAGFTASGATAPTGSLGALTGAVFSDSLIDLFHSVLPEYRTNAAWLMADKTAAVVRKTKDGSGQYVWERSLVPGNPLTIDNKPFYIGTSLPSPTGTSKIVYFGDWSALVVRIAGGLRFERSTDYHFGNDQVTFRAIVRSDAAAVDPNAVKFLQLTAS